MSAAAAPLSPSQGKALAQVAKRVGRCQGGSRLSDKTAQFPRGVTPSEAPLVETYTALRNVDPEVLGLHNLEPTDEALTQAQADQILKEVVTVLDETHGWQRRSAGSRGPSSGVLETQRKTFGCELASDYAIIGRSEVPGPLRELGERLARFCAQHEWPYSHTAIGGGSDGAARWASIKSTSSATCRER